MSADTNPTIEDLFRSLDKWRHFAGYPLETRVDALIGLFLPAILEDHCGVAICPQVIPQFPIKKEGDNQSNKADFFALSKCGERAFLIEIKTDMGSRNQKQDKYLEDASEKSMDCILSDIKELAGNKNLAKSNRRKYLHVLYELDEVGLIKIPSTLMGIEWSERDAVGIFDQIGQIGICAPSNPKPEVIYIQPKKHCGDRTDIFQYIYFDKVAESVKDQGELGELLACYLQKWETAAGERRPEKQ